jgi:hypothetical protein
MNTLLTKDKLNGLVEPTIGGMLYVAVPVTERLFTIIQLLRVVFSHADVVAVHVQSKNHQTTLQSFQGVFHFPTCFRQALIGLGPVVSTAGGQPPEGWDRVRSCCAHLQFTVVHTVSYELLQGVS